MKPPPLREALWVVTRKELREIVRDRRSLFVLLLLPVALYPLLFIGSMLAASAQLRSMAKKEHRVWVEGLDALPVPLRDHLRELRAPRKAGKGRAINVRLSEPPKDADYERDLRTRRVAAVIPRVPDLVRDQTVEIEVLYNSAFDSSTLLKNALTSAIRAWREDLIAQRLREEKLSPQTFEPVLARPRDRGPPGALAGRMLSILVVVLALTSAFYPALDLGAGEKERGTLETLLLAPVPRITLAMGKVLATFVIALASAALNLVSLGLTFASASRFAPQGVAELDLQLSLWILPVMLLVLLPLVLLFSALSLALSTFAASYKEGQAYLTPVMAIGTLPAMAAALPGVELTPPLALVPVLGASLLMKALLAQSAGALEVVLVTASSLAYAAVGVRWVAALYQREEVLWRPAAAEAPDLFGRGEGQRPLPTVPQAAAMAVMALLLFWFVGVSAQQKGIVPGLVFTLVVLIALPPVIYAKWLGCDLGQTFSLRRPRALAWPAALLLGVGCLALNLAFVQLQGRSVAPPDNETLEQLTQMVGSMSTWQLVLLMAILPALCEETLCRGFVLRGLQSEGGTASAVFVSAIVFSVLHLDPARLLPTFFLGVVLAILVVRSGSLFPAMVLHFVNNGLVLLLGGYGSEWGLIADQLPTARGWAIAIPCLLGGVALLVGLSPAEEPPQGEPAAATT